MLNHLFRLPSPSGLDDTSEAKQLQGEESINHQQFQGQFFFALELPGIYEFTNHLIFHI